jgi:hypothetical protein
VTSGNAIDEALGFAILALGALLTTAVAVSPAW